MADQNRAQQANCRSRDAENVEKVPVVQQERRYRRELGQRIAQIRQPLTQESYAQRLGVHVNTLARYERGERLPGAEFLRRLGMQGVNLQWLMTGQGNAIAGAEAGIESLGVQEVSSFASLRAAQHGHRPPTADEVLDRPSSLFFDEYWLQRRWGLSNTDTCVVQVQGNGMEPLLRAGDQVLVDRTQTKVERDGLYLLRFREGMMVRQLEYLSPGCYRVLSTNSAHPSFIVDTHIVDAQAATTAGASDEAASLSALEAGLVAMTVSVLGRVLWIGQCL